MSIVPNSKESAENLSFTNEGSSSASTPHGVLSGNGGPRGLYRISARAAKWAGGSASFVNHPGNTIFATFSLGNDGHVDAALPAGTYMFTFNGKPQGVQASVRAI